jgi:hypothetical protein
MRMQRTQQSALGGRSFRHAVRHRAGRLSATLTACAALTLVAAGTPLAVGTPTATAGSCTHRTGVSHTDYMGNVFRQDWVCGNAAPTTVYANTDYGYIAGWLDSRRSWYVCWRIGQLHGGGNKVWYRTQGDRVGSDYYWRRGWGYVPAVSVETSVDPWYGMPAC